MKHTATFLFLISLLFTGGHYLMGQPKSLEALEAGKRALALGDYSKAQQELEYCRKLNPTTPYLYAFLAKAYYYQSDLNRAIYSFNKSLENDYISRADGSVELIYQNSVSLNLDEQEMLDPALMYYQRGRAHHLKRNDEQAIADMEKALSINSYYQEAQVYLEHIRKGRGPLLIEAPITQSKNPEEEEGITENRPESVGKVSLREDDVRKARSIYFEVEEPDGRRDKRYLKKEKRTKYFEGIKIDKPKVGFATQSYIKIERIQLTSNQTLVTFLLENPSKDSSYSFKLREDLLITSRNGGRTETYRMIKASQFSEGPVELEPGKKLRFSAIFPDVPRDMSYINIIEGRRNDGKEWNFYDVQLFN